jgi:NAD dependent epimerase/dehydratase family enzyme
MHQMKKKIVIAGGTGFIGNHLVVEFKKAGYLFRYPGLDTALENILRHG